MGTDAEVLWIVGGTTSGLTVTSAIPPVFDAYATIVIPDTAKRRESHDQAILALLSEQSAHQPWWLGYIETGADDTVFPDAPKVTLYAGWPYVVVRQGPTRLPRGGGAVWRPLRGAPCPTSCSPLTAHGSSPGSGTTIGVASADRPTS